MLVPNLNPSENLKALSKALSDAKEQHPDSPFISEINEHLLEIGELPEEDACSLLVDLINLILPDPLIFGLSDDLTCFMVWEDQDLAAEIPQ